MSDGSDGRDPSRADVTGDGADRDGPIPDRDESDLGRSNATDPDDRDGVGTGSANRSEAESGERTAPSSDEPGVSRERPPAATDEAGDRPGDGDDPSLGTVLGAVEERHELVPGDPSPENVAFVLLGVLGALFVVYRAWAVFVGG